MTYVAENHFSFSNKKIKWTIKNMSVTEKSWRLVKSTFTLWKYVIKSVITAKKNKTRT